MKISNAYPLWVLTFCCLLSACNDDKAAALIAAVSVEKISTDQFAFLEGPAWDGHDTLYFTDIPNNRIHAYQPRSNTFSVFLEESNGTNGLLFNRDGQLLNCEQDTGLISLLDMQTKRKSVLVDAWQGVRFNRPNDLVIDKQGGIYFTDPSWSDERPQAVRGVYYFRDGTTSQLVVDMEKPNGIILSQDESALYIVDSGNFKVRAYQIDAPGKISNGLTFATLQSDNNAQDSNADGLAIDVLGNLYVSYRHGVSVFDKKGKALGTISIPEGPSNLEFGGKDLKTLFITAHTNLYKAELPFAGVRFPQ